MIMKTIIFTITFIIALLWVGDLTITFKPFSISLPGWHKALGIILFVFAMAVYNIGEYAKGYKHGFDDGVKECIEAIKGNGKNTIDFCYFRLKILCKQLSNTKSNIERLVDKACGYNETEEIRKECIMLVEQIIESKKQIGEDFTRDERVLNKLKRNEQ